jgi:hypothetical protein
MSNLVNKDGKTILQIDVSNKNQMIDNAQSIESWLKNRIFDSISVQTNWKNELTIGGIGALYLIAEIETDEIKVSLRYCSSAKESTIKPIKTFVVGDHNFCHYDMEELALELLRRKELEDSRLASEKIKVEETKLNVLYVAGELSLIGFPTEYVKFREGNTVIDIEIPVNRKSKVTKNYIRLNVRKTRNKIKDISDNTKLDISFVKKTTNRRDKIVSFENISFLDSKIILKGFKDAYFKEDADAIK